jgi:hypothetical protein
MLTSPKPLPEIKLYKDLAEKWLKMLFVYGSSKPYLYMPIIDICELIIDKTAGKLAMNDMKIIFENTMAEEYQKVCNRKNRITAIHREMRITRLITLFAKNSFMRKSGVIKLWKAYSEHLQIFGQSLISSLIGLIHDTREIVEGENKETLTQEDFQNARITKKNLNSELQRNKMSVSQDSPESIQEILNCLDIVIAKSTEIPSALEPEASTSAATELGNFEMFVMNMEHDRCNENLEISLKNPKRKAEVFFTTAIQDHLMASKFAFVLKNLVMSVPDGVQFRDALVNVCKQNFTKQLSKTDVNHGFTDIQIDATSKFISDLAMNRMISLEEFQVFDDIVGELDPEDWGVRAQCAVSFSQTVQRINDILANP